MATEKVSLTLDEKVLKQARARARGKGLSAVINESLREHFQLERAREAIREWEEEFGAFTPEEIKKGQEAWQEILREHRKQTSGSSSTRARSSRSRGAKERRRTH